MVVAAEQELLRVLAGGRRSHRIEDVAEAEVTPLELRRWVAARVADSGEQTLPRVRVLESSLEARVAWLARLCTLFTFRGAGAMSRRPLAGEPPADGGPPHGWS